MGKLHLVVTFALGSVFTLIILQMSMLVQHIEQPGSLKDSHRMTQLEDQVFKIQQSLEKISQANIVQDMVQGLEKKITEQLEQMSVLTEAFQEQLQAAITCPLHLSDFSKSGMIKAGWAWTMNKVNFGAAGFSGWADGKDVGTMSLRIAIAGNLHAVVVNAHMAADPENVVHVWLNQEHLLQLGAGESRRFCLTVEADDIFSLSENYGQVHLVSLELECKQETGKGASMTSRSNSSSGQSRCMQDQQIWVPASHFCQDQPLLAPARFDRILNETRAIVRLDNRSSDNFSQYKIVYARHAFSDPGGNTSASCTSFEFRRQRIGIVLVINPEFQARFGSQITSQRCYAAWHSYDYHLLDNRDYPKCLKYNGYRDFFFQKHCVVAEFLAQQEAGYVAAVVDGDVVAAVLERGLEEWTRIDADIQFYERIWCTEIAAGNYIVRNTPWARDFLLQWASYVHDQPSGYSSADNGAIHLHLVRTLHLEGADKCANMYHGIVTNLTQSKTLDRDLDPYFRFVNCTKRLLGPPRLWHAHDGGRLAIWGRAHFFVVDGVYLGQSASDFFGPVFHHGIKEQDAVTKQYYADVGKCRVNKGMTHNREGFVDKVFSQLSWLADYLARLGVTFPEVKPGEAGNCSKTRCFKPCALTLSCPLLRHDEEPQLAAKQLLARL